MKNILNKNDGFASIMAVCLLVLFTALGTVCLLSASSYLRNIQQRQFYEQCKVYAVSLSKIIETNLCKESNVEKFNDSSYEGTVYKYIYEKIIKECIETAHQEYKPKDFVMDQGDNRKLTISFKTEFDNEGYLAAYSSDPSTKRIEYTTLYMYVKSSYNEGEQEFEVTKEFTFEEADSASTFKLSSVTTL